MHVYLVRSDALFLFLEPHFVDDPKLVPGEQHMKMAHVGVLPDTPAELPAVTGITPRHVSEAASRWFQL